MKVKIFKYLS